MKTPVKYVPINQLQWHIANACKEGLRVLYLPVYITPQSGTLSAPPLPKEKLRPDLLHDQATV